MIVIKLKKLFKKLLLSKIIIKFNELYYKLILFYIYSKNNIKYINTDFNEKNRKFSFSFYNKQKMLAIYSINTIYNIKIEINIVYMYNNYYNTVAILDQVFHNTIRSLKYICNHYTQA